jgi:hypothetical protein
MHLLRYGAGKKGAKIRSEQRFFRHAAMRCVAAQH